MLDGVVFSNLGSLCEPKDEISQNRLNDKWCSYSYTTADFKGEMLISLKNSKAPDVSFNPELSGWYKIFVGLYASAYDTSEIALKLSSDKTFEFLGTYMKRDFARYLTEDVFWRCAKMDEESVVIGKPFSEGYEKDSMISWLRFVPMTDAEIEEYLKEKERTDTKCLYTTNDMHGMLCFYDMEREGAWKSVVEEYRDSDTEWLAVESLAHISGEITDCAVEKFSFKRSYDKSFYTKWRSAYSDDTLKEIVSYGKEKGLKMCVSLRVSEWGMNLPYDKIHFEQEFVKNNPHLRCIDRDGDVTEYMSFVYPEVQKYIIDSFIKMAQTGCDAVQLLFSRGWPFVLFEKPFTDKFFELYGEDARLLPLDDERIIELKCNIMTDFVRNLRKALDEAGYKDTELHAKVLFSLYDNKLVGLDLEEWAKEGLINRIVSDERRIREILPSDIMENGKINLEKYTAYANSSVDEPILYEYDRIFEPMADSKGKLCGPKSNTERIKEFMELENKYGITVYIEIMPRSMSIERMAEKAREIYDAGCNHIGLWDTYSRTRRRAEWNMWRSIGHKDELDEILKAQDSLHTVVRLIELGGKNVRAYMATWGG